MPETALEQRIATLETQVQALAKDLADQLHGHCGPVEWDDEQGWIMVVAAGRVA